MKTPGTSPAGCGVIALEGGVLARGPVRRRHAGYRQRPAAAQRVAEPYRANLPTAGRVGLRLTLLGCASAKIQAGLIPSSSVNERLHLGLVRGSSPQPFRKVVIQSRTCDEPPKSQSYAIEELLIKAIKRAKKAIKGR